MIYPLSGMRKEAGFLDNLKRYSGEGYLGAPSYTYWNGGILGLLRKNPAEDAATTINSVYGKPGKGVYWNNPTQGKRQIPDSFKKSLKAGLLGGAAGLAEKYVKPGFGR